MWRAAEVCTTHTSALQQQAGPWKCSWQKCQGTRAPGTACSLHCRPPGSAQGFWGGSFTDQCVINVISQAGEGKIRPCRWHPELCESRTGIKRWLCFCFCSRMECWSSWICSQEACCLLLFHVLQWDWESYKSLDHFNQVLILQPAASQKVIN